MQEGPSHDVGGGMGVCLDPKLAPQKPEEKQNHFFGSGVPGHQAHFFPLIRLSLPRAKLSSCRIRTRLSAVR